MSTDTLSCKLWLPPSASHCIIGEGNANVICSLRAVQTSDYMSAGVYEFPWKLLQKISSRIVNEVDGVSRVTYDM